MSRNRRKDRTPVPAPCGIDPSFARLLGTIAQDARMFLMPHWRMSDLRPNDRPILSTGMCDVSSNFLQRVLEQNNIKSDFNFGWKESGKGYYAFGGWNSHGWLSSRNAIIDITADQFGGPSITITTADDPIYRKSNDVTLVKAVATRANKEAGMWWQEWQKHQIVTLLPLSRTADFVRYDR